jgi:hypothetical protein
MSFEMFTFDGLRKPAKGSKKVCGCRMEQTRRGVPMVICPNGMRRFADRKTAVALFRKEQATGTFCVFLTRGRRCKAGKRRVGGRCVVR